MQNSKFSKIYAGFSIVYCVLLSLIALMTIVIPTENYGFTSFNEENQFLYHTVIAVLTLFVFTPQPIALMSFYFSGGIGKNWFSHIVFGALILSFLSLVLLIFYFIYLQFAGIPAFYFDSIKNQPLEKFAVPIMLLGFLHSLFFPILFAISALVVKKVDLLTRFLPIFSVVSAILLARISAYVIIAIGSITGSQSIYQGSREATYPHWFMLGSIAWALIGLAAIWKTKSVLTENVSPINASPQEFQNPIISTFEASASVQKSNKQPLLILVGIAAIALIGVLSIVAAAVGLVYFSRPQTTFEGIPNTNRAQVNTSSNRQISPQPKDLKTLLESRKNLFGDFKLYQINRPDENYFPYPKDKIYATFYSPKEPKKLTFIALSVFKNVEDARKEIEFRKKLIGEQKSKIKSEEKHENGVTIALKDKENFEIFECCDEVCFTIRDKDESVPAMFRVWLVKQIVNEARKLARDNSTLSD